MLLGNGSSGFFTEKNQRFTLFPDRLSWDQPDLQCSPYYVPRIRDILLRLAGAKCLSTLDVNMGYYARRLATSSRNYTAFCLPFGKF